jgi:hypothetical protein
MKQLLIVYVIATLIFLDGCLRPFQRKHQDA